MSPGCKYHSHLLSASRTHLRTRKMRAASWLWWLVWYPIAEPILDKLAQTSPQPLSSCKCFKFGQTMQRKPVLDTNRTLVLEQLRSSQNASTNCALLSLGNSPEFKQCAIEGASSRMAVKRSLRFSPRATSVGLSGQFWSASPGAGRTTCSPMHVQSLLDVFHKWRTFSRTVSSCTCR